MTKVRYEEMLPDEIRAARTECPIAYMGIGGVEWHGEHLAVGNDTLKAHALAIRCAKEGGGLAFPPLYYGENREWYLMDCSFPDRSPAIMDKMGLPHENFRPGYMRRTPYDQDAAYIQLLYHILREIESLGFKVIIVIAGHYPLLAHARAAVEWYRLDARAKAWACSGYELVKDVISDAGDHAAKWETSLLMHLRPDCVDMSRLPADLDEELIGVGGIDPRKEASPEFGKRGVDAVVERVIEKARSLLP